MIYKFVCVEGNATMELYQTNENDKERNSLVFDICENGTRNYICLDKKDVYHLIGALHLLQKEMK